MSKASDKAADKAEAIAALHKILRPGSTVYTVLNKVSSSGMSRRITVLALDLDYEHRAIIRNVGWLVARATGTRIDLDRHELIVSGGGMDMGFAVVYGLGAVMWPRGTPEPHGTRNGQPDTAGGYALKHAWL